MIENLNHYIPLNAKKALEELLNKYHFNLKIVKGRKTKRGDFRATTPIPTITINNNLSKEQFLITLVHEIAHLETYLHFPSVKPHGVEWKNNFQRLMLPFLNPEVFNNDLLKLLAKHFINPKATTDSDFELSRLLKQKNKNSSSDNYFIFDLKPGNIFEINNRIFKILNKRRTRYECVELKTQQRFLINGNASVKFISSIQK